MAVTLYTYMQRVQQLLADVKSTEVNPDFLVAYINTARGQVAAEGECLKSLATLPTVNGTQSYGFGAITGLGSGVQAVIAARMISVTQSTIKVMLTHRSWEWFNQFNICAAAAATGVPTTWAQYGQGQSGTIFLFPVPNAVLTLNLDCVCIPNDLALNTDTEALPYPWTDAVAYFAAYLAYMNAQNKDGSDRMMALYEMFMRRARQMTTPTVLPQEYAGGPGAHLAAQQVPVTGAAGGKQ